MTIEEIKRSYNIEDVIGRTINLKPQGTELVGNCPFHDDHHASLKVSKSKQRFKCFVSGCGAGGDVIDFFTLQGYSKSEAMNIIVNNNAISPAQSNRTEVEKKPYLLDAIPNQSNLPNIKNVNHYKYGTPSNSWAYHNQYGNIIGYVCRFDLPEGKKDVIPYTYKTDGQKSGWYWKGFETPRPLYNLHELTQCPEKIVLMVEGEKTADAAKLLFPQYVVTTWIGGSESVKNTDFTPLHGRKIMLWNDNDLPGVLCMFGGWSFNDKTNQYKRITGICEMFPAQFKRILNSPDFPKKWDVADHDNWSLEFAAEYIKKNRTDVPTVSEFPPNELPLAEPISQALPPVPKIEPVPEKPVLSEPTTSTNQYYKCLGFENNDQNLYVFFVYRTNVIVKLSASGINTSNLLQLAPLNYWETKFPKKGSVKFDLSMVADNLINNCSKMGIFNPNKIRGRGAWIDNGIPVIHCGDTLIVDGKYMSFNEHKSKYIYEAGQELGFNLVKPMVNEDAYKLIKLLERLNWARSINSRLLAGWIVIAPLCGALKWRSHMWVTGASGAGKSEIMKLFVKRLLGNVFVDAQGSTTEAGIRQYLKADALPVIFDEAESEDKKGKERMQSVLEIMRASSTSEGGKIIKGSSGGNASQYDIRSCFAFASIAADLSQRSDISRITVLEIKEDLRKDKNEHWKETLQLYYSVINDDYVAAFQSRAVKLLPVILKNAETFSAAAAIELDNKRTGDQLGTLLAGAYSLTSEKLISFEDARKWVKERDWSDEKMKESTKDEMQVINKLMNSNITIETAYGPKTRTIGETILAARGDHRDAYESGMITPELANITLKRIGMFVDKNDMYLSDTSDFISKCLMSTSYSRNYAMILSRIANAEIINSVMFGSGIKSRAVKIDTRIVFDEINKQMKSKTNAPDPPKYSQGEINL